jgi:type II secretion system protein G
MAPSRSRRGFTLIEILVVVMIIGILVAIAVPNYRRTMENARADSAVTDVRMIASTNRMYRVDRGANGWAAGAGSFDAVNGAACAQPGDATPNPTSNLVACGYLARQEWATKPYQYFTCDGCGTPCAGAGPFNVACARRRTSGTNSINTAPFNAWGYNVDNTGVITPVGGAPAAAQ